MRGLLKKVLIVEKGWKKFALCCRSSQRCDFLKTSQNTENVH